MKKKLLSALSLLMLYFGSIAQTNIANYTFTSSVGAYTPLTGATTYTNAWDDQVSAAIPLGGNFVFGGVTYTTCFIGSNGHVSFGAAASTTNYTPISTLGSTTGMISGFGCDGASSTLATAAPLISYMNVGSEFVVEFKDHATYNGRAAEAVNFQIRLNLTTNQIKIVYGACTAPNYGYTPQVGIRGNSTTWASNVNNLLIGNVPASTTCDWTKAVTNSASTGGLLYNPSNLNVVPVTGLTFAWDAPAGTLAPVRAFSAVSGIGTTSAVIAWTAPTSATQYNLQYRIPGSCTWTNFSGNPVSAATATLTGLTASTIYQVRVQSSNGTTNAIWSHIPNQAGTGSGYVAAGTFSTIASCVAPTALNYTSLTATTAGFTWTPGATETNWDVYYGPQPLTVPSGTTVPTTTTTSPVFNLTGLTPNTAYAIYVRANCGGPSSNWTAVTNFTTSCLNTTLPFTEGFNSTSMPSCWSQQYVTGTSNMQFVASSSNPGTTPFEGTDYVYWNSYSYSNLQETRLVSPPITTTGTLSVDVNFRWYNENNTSYVTGQYATEGVTVEYSLNGITWNTVQFFPRHDGSFAAGTGGWNLKTLTLPAGAGNQSTIYVGFKFHSGFGDNCSLDKVDIIGTPTCTQTPVAGVITGTNNLNVNTSGGFTISPAVGNLQWYTTPSATSTVFSSVPSGTNSTINYTATTAGTVFLTVIASNPGCPNDTANVPFQVIVNPLPGDMACSPVPLTVGPASVYHKLVGYGIQTNEIAPPGTACQTNTTWCNATLNNTKWFSFTAPTSGNVTVQSPGFDTQLAVWSTGNCADLTSATTPATLVAANDDDAQYTAHGGVQYSSYVNALCLTPGATYYIQLDSYSAATANDSTKVEIIDLGANTFTTLAANYCTPAATVALGANIPGGVFTLDASSTAITAFDPTTAGVGTHTVYYNVYGCISSSVTNVSASPNVSAASSATAICSGSSVTLTASGANTYLWNTSSTNTVVVDSPTGNTTYTVTGTTGACSGTNVVSVVVNALPSVSITGTNTICSGQSVILTGNGANTYSWSTAATTNTISDSPANTTVYTVNGTDANSCSNTATFAVTVNQNPTVTVSGGSVCSGGSFTLSPSGATTYTYLPSGPVVTPASTTAYTITGTDALGCVSASAAVASVAVNATPTLVIGTSTLTVCAGTTVNIGVTGANTYTWSTGANGAAISPTVNGTTSYSVVGQSSVGCNATASVTINATANPTVAAISSASLICVGQTASLTASGAATYVWNTTSTNTIIAVSPTVTTSYTVTGTTSGCSSNFVISQAVSPCTGINAKAASTIGTLVYPNPNTGEFTVELNNGSVKTIDVMDLTGRIILSNTTSNDKVDFNINTLANGIYFVKVQSNNSVEVIKIVKQ